MEKVDFTATGYSSWIDYAIDPTDPNIMVQCLCRSIPNGDGWAISIDVLQYKKRSLTISERIKNWAILRLGGRLKECYTLKYLYRT